MNLYQAILGWLIILVLLALAVALTWTALRPPQSPPNTAAWGARLPARPRHCAPARIRVVERTEPRMRVEQVNRLNDEDRPGRHSAEHLTQVTCLLPDLPMLIREYKL